MACGDGLLCMSNPHWLCSVLRRSQACPRRAQSVTGAEEKKREKPSSEVRCGTPAAHAWPPPGAQRVRQMSQRCSYTAAARWLAPDARCGRRHCCSSPPAAEAPCRPAKARKRTARDGKPSCTSVECVKSSVRGTLTRCVVEGCAPGQPVKRLELRSVHHPPPDCCHTAVFVVLPESQVWEDVRKAEGVHDGKVGPLGTTDK